eukprot:Nk52_evm39s2531 gene=Nk52_evmTU39s2531
MGASASKIEKTLGSKFPENERYFGLENYGNTCYGNSVIQALYYCRPFRIHLEQYQPLKGKEYDETILSSLAELFVTIAHQKKKCGVVGPRRFIACLRRENELFRGNMHQDAHEFLNYLLNTIAELLQEEKKIQLKAQHENALKDLDGRMTAQERKEALNTWVHDIFEGTLTNETTCLTCETVSSKDESFLDLSVDIEQNSSITSCLKKFSSTEVLHSEHKYFCETCCSLQEGQKRMRIKRLPNVLALHLKRFKYIEELQRYKKLSHRVVFPLELKLFNTSDDTVDQDRVYDLFAVVIHVGSGPNHGHYISIVKSHDYWLIFDDDNVELMEEKYIQSFFGSSWDTNSSTESGYILFYETRNKF